MRALSLIISTILLSGLSTLAAAPQEKEKPKGDKNPPRGADMITLTGKIEKQITERKREDGSVLKVPAYSITEGSGNKVALPAPRRRDNGELIDKINLEEYTGKNVILTGRGLTAKTSERPDATTRVVKVLEITSVKLAK